MDKDSKKTLRSDCDTCENLLYDEEMREYYCDIDMDEDEMLRFMTYSNYNCPYYRTNDEYRIVRKQN